MRISKRASLGAAFACALAVFVANESRAHFLWLASSNDGSENQGLLFFSEGPSERDYHLPESIAKAELFFRTAENERRKLDVAAVDEDDFVGLKSSETLPATGVLESACQYGVYHGTLLTYYAKHYVAPNARGAKELGPSPEMKLDAAPELTKDGFDVTVYWNGEPAEGVSVGVVGNDGAPVEETTNKNGRASFAAIKHGLIGLLINKPDALAKGEFDGEKYESASNYASITFDYQGMEAESKDGEEAAEAQSMPALPEGIASFGAAVADDWLYVYGGHTGEAHNHSRDNLSQSFSRLRLSESGEASGEWEPLPMQTPLQGLALVAYGGRVYRIGGMNATNADGEPEDMHSSDEFAVFAPETQEWTALAPLPAPRSSHDAVVIDGVLYVLGGWRLDGGRGGEWHDAAWSYDLTDSDAAWEEITTPPFRRRALATAQWQGKVVALGGIDGEGSVSSRVDTFDPKSGEWEQLPELPGEGMRGFGASAWNLEEQLYASAAEGVLYRLADDGQSWIAVCELDEPRFFHRLAPLGKKRLVAVGGASHEGHLADLEVLDPTPLK